MPLREGVGKIVAWVEGNHHKLILVMFGLLLFAGVIYSINLQDQLRYLPDELDYVTLTNNLVSRQVYSLDGVSPTAFRPPGYPLILILPGYLNAGVVYYRILNFVLLCLSLYITYRFLCENISPLAGVIGALLVMVYPVLFYTAGTLYPQTLAAFLLLLVIYLMTQRTGRVINFVIGGLFLGFLVITVPTNAFLLVVFSVWLLLRYRSPRWVFICLASAILVIGIWTARNYLVFHDFVFVSTNSGENLLTGNSKNATPNGGRTVDLSQYEQQASGLNELERDRYYQSRAIEFIFENKTRALELYTLKVLNYFNYRNELVTESEGSSIRDTVMLFTYGPLLLLFILRLVMLKSYRPSIWEKLLITIYLISAFISGIFFSRIRFRLPYDFLLIIIDAVFIGWLLCSFIPQPDQSYLSPIDQVESFPLETEPD